MSNIFAARSNSVQTNNSETVYYVDFVRLTKDQVDTFVKEDFKQQKSMLGQKQIEAVDGIAKVNGQIVSAIFCNGITSEDKARKAVAKDLGSGVSSSDLRKTRIKTGKPDEGKREMVRPEGPENTYLAAPVSQNGYVTFHSDRRLMALVDWLSGDSPQLAVINKENGNLMEKIFPQSEHFGEIILTEKADRVKMSESFNIRFKVPPMGETHFFRTDEKEEDIDIKEADEVDPFDALLTHGIKDTNVLIADQELAATDICNRSTEHHDQVDGETVTSLANIDLSLIDKEANHLVSEKDDVANIIKLESLF